MAGMKKVPLFLVVVLFCLSCNDNLTTALQEKVAVSEKDPPVPGGSGALSVGTPRATVIPLSWTEASDGISAQSELEYRVVYSPQGNIDTVVDATANGTVAIDWTKDLAGGDVTGLSVLTKYYMNVIVRDRAGNVATYASASATTTDDTTNPTVGNSGTIAVGTLTTDGYAVSWTKATDDISPQNKLKYQAYTSKSNNISTVALALANGTPNGTLSTDISSVTLTNLDDNVLYYVNILVQDEKGNTAAYQTNSATTNKYPRIYWIERSNHRIRRADLDGSLPQLVYDTGTGTQPYAIAIDSVHRHIYYTQQAASQTISRIDFNGANRVDLITSNVTTPRGIAVDTVNGKVYWTDYANDKIYAAPLSAVNADANTYAITTLTAGSQPNGIVLDVSNNKMYWTEEGGTGRLCKADLDGLNVATVDDSDVTDPIAMSIDTANSWLYFTDRTTLVVGRVKTNGTFYTAIINTHVYAPRGVAIDTVNIGNQYVYWTDTTSHNIYRAPSNLSGLDADLYIMTNIDTSSGAPTGIEVY